MKLTESKLRQIIREEIYEGELLRNTQIELRLSFPKREYVSYQDIWPMMKIFKKNTNVRFDASKFKVHRMQDLDADLHNMDIVGVHFTANAANIAYSLNRIEDLPEVSLIGPKRGDMAAESRFLSIYPQTEGEGFPYTKVSVVGVEGALRDKQGHNAREAAIRALKNRLIN